MPGEYALVIFDLDGTLMDTREGVLLSLRHTLEELGLPQLEEAVMYRFIGPPLSESFQKNCGMSKEEAEAAAKVFRRHYSQGDMYKALVYPGMMDALAQLRARGRKLAVATYKTQTYALPLLERFGLAAFMDSMRGGDGDKGNKLKKEDLIRQCMQDCGIDRPEEVLMVGDTDFDAKGAKAAGVDFLGVSFGFGYKEVAQVEADGGIGCAAGAIEILDFA